MMADFDLDFQFGSPSSVVRPSADRWPGEPIGPILSLRR
jgi:hypothetical protein